MLDHLSELRTCEDDFLETQLPLVPKRSVVCPGVWGQTGFDELVSPIIDDQKLTLTVCGLTMDGISLIFDSQKDAAMFRLFFQGETEVVA